MDRTYRILIAEDDEDIAELLKLYLENDGYEVILKGDGLAALEAVREEAVDLAVVDLMMPKMNGYELIKAIRENSHIPILILSAKNQDSDKIQGLDIGADDYLAKPFNPLELAARVRSSLRRVHDFNRISVKKQSHILQVGELSLDTEGLQLTKNGKEIALTPTEYKLLAILMKEPGKIYTKVQLYRGVNGDYCVNDENTMTVHISKLREKIEQEPRSPKYIKTVRGVGYKIERH